MTVRLVLAAVTALLAAALALPTAAEATPPPSAAGTAAAASASVSLDDKPLVIVLDVSGSMDDDDGAGQTKLQSAKLAVERAVRARGIGSPIGLWAFPGASSCSAGSMIVPPEPQQDLAEVIAKSDALVTTDGGTPIGKAMEGTAAALTLRGFSSATMLLVTDGLNNCEPDPCAVAKDVVRRGFDLTVDAVGFRAEAGADEALSCIANATGGSVTDAKDGPALQKVLEGLAVPTLKTVIAAPTTVLAGQTAEISVTVSNPSSNDAPQVRSNLAFQRTATRSVQPTVDPPTWDLGNLPAGGSITRTWAITTERSWKGAAARFAVTTWTVGGQSVRDEGGFTLSENPVPPEGALFGGVSATRPLVIMGDSYSVGEGAGGYVAASSNASAQCHRSPLTSLADVLPAREVRNLACSGAETWAFWQDQTTDDGDWRADAQYDQLRDLADPPAVVVLTLGGNDAKFADVVKACVIGTRLTPAKKCRSDSAFADEERAGIADRWSTLRDIDERVWAIANQPRFVAARGGAYAPVVISTYPQAFWPERKGDCSATLNRGEIAFGNELASALLSSAKRAATAASDAGYEVYFAPNALAAFQPDHTYCASDGETDLRRLVVGAPQAMHPTEGGYLAITTAITTWAGGVQRAQPSTAAKADAASGSAAPAPLLEWAVAPGTAAVDLVQGSTVAVQPGQTVTMHLSGFAPGSPVAVTLHSAPFPLGTVLVGADGTGTLRTVIPEGVPLGAHRIVAAGFSAGGADRVVSAPARVEQPTPVWVVACVALSALVLLGLALAGIVGAARRRTRGGARAS